MGNDTEAKIIFLCTKQLIMKKKKFLLLLAFATTVLLQAQPTLEQCKELARAHYPLVRQYDLIAQSEEYTIKNASRAWLPQVAFSSQATYQSAVMEWPETFESMLAAQGLDMPGLRKDQYKVQLDIQQNIWDGGKSRADKQIACLEAEQSRKALEVEFYQLESRVEELYFGLLLLQEQEKQMLAMMERLQQNLNYVNALVQEGVAMQADADAVEVQILSSNQQLRQVQSQEASFRKMLALFIGETLEEGDLSLPQNPGQNTELPSAYTSELRPEFDYFNAQISLLEGKKKLATTSVMPRIGVFAQGYYGYPGLNMFENMMNSDWSLNGIVGIRLHWNFSGLYTLKNAGRQLDNAIQGIHLSKDVFSFNTQLQLEQENAEISRLKAALQDDDKIVKLRRQVREAAEARLQEGEIDMNSLLTTISDETAASIARSTREIELIKAIYQLKHTLNN